MSKINAKIMPIYDDYTGITWLITSKRNTCGMYEFMLIDFNFKVISDLMNHYYSCDKNDSIFNSDSKNADTQQDKEYLHVWSGINYHLTFNIKNINIEQKKQHALSYDYKQINSWFYSIPKTNLIYWKNNVKDDDKKKYLELWFLMDWMHDTRRLMFNDMLTLRRLEYDEYDEVTL